MHGRKRETPAQTAERKLAAAPKAALYAQLQASVVSRRAAKQHDVESHALCARLLELNPEVLTAWNFRRDTLRALCDGQPAEREEQLLGEELQLTERALRRNPKSYGAWNQRRWSVRQLGERADMGHELALCAKLLAADERNFHCWNYRRYIAYLASTPAADEVAFARAKIDANFSNYSAWHHRSSVLRQAQTQQLYAASGAASACDNLAARLAGPLCAPALAVADRGQPLGGDVLSSEFELVTQAFYTEPEDQAAWFYHDWLLDQALESARQAGSSGVTWGQARERLCAQAETCRQLRELEPSCRWPGLTLVHVLRAIMAGDAACGGGEAGLPEGRAASYQRGDALREARDVLAAVAAVDPMRRGLYTDLLTELEGTAVHE